MIELIITKLYEKEDYQRIMDFLSEMYQENKNQHCWLPARWEYAEHLVNPLYVERGNDDWEPYIKLWEDDGKLVGISHPEETYNAFLQVRPGYQELEPDMIKWAEQSITKPVDDSKSKLVIWANDSDKYRKDLLMERNYKKGEEGCYLNRLDLDKDFEPELPAGYKFRSMDEEISFVKRYNVLNKSFHPEDDFIEEVPDSFMKMVQAPMYRPELDLIIEDENGNFASSCVIWFDEENEIGMFEPVGTHPDYTRKGLGKQLIIEGLRRLKNIGAKQAYVESYGANRYKFYKKTGFKSYDIDYPWIKIFAK